MRTDQTSNMWEDSKKWEGNSVQKLFKEIYISVFMIKLWSPKYCFISRKLVRSLYIVALYTT